jgi:hypothetical protein
LPLAEPSDDLLNQQGLVVFWATNTPGGTKLNLKLRDSDDAIIKASVGPTVLYDYTVVTPQASIDTFVNDGGNGVGVDLSGAHNILEMWIVGRTDQAADNSQHDVILNNDTGAHYDQQVIQGVGGGFNVFANQATNAWTFAMRGDNSLAGYASVQRFSFPSYATSDFFKTAESILGMVNDDGGQNFARTEALGWRSTDPITRVKMTSVGTYLAGTRLLIYGR